jgi:hypothetical protein
MSQMGQPVARAAPAGGGGVGPAPGWGQPPTLPPGLLGGLGGGGGSLDGFLPIMAGMSRTPGGGGGGAAAMPTRGGQGLLPGAGGATPARGVQGLLPGAAGAAPSPGTQGFTGTYTKAPMTRPAGQTRGGTAPLGFDWNAYTGGVRSGR